MNTLLHRKSPLNGSRRADSTGRVELSEKHPLEIMGFFLVSGLISVVAAVFTNMIPMPSGQRDFWLFICVATFGLLVVGIALFFLSYKGDRYSVPNRK